MIRRHFKFPMLNCETAQNSLQCRYNWRDGVSITSLTIVYLTVNSGADQRKHQSSASLAFVRGIHRWPVNCLHKWPVMRNMFPFDHVIMYDGKITVKNSTEFTYHICNQWFVIILWHYLEPELGYAVGTLKCRIIRASDVYTVIWHDVYLYIYIYLYTLSEQKYLRRNVCHRLHKKFCFTSDFFFKWLIKSLKVMTHICH